MSNFWGAVQTVLQGFQTTFLLWVWFGEEVIYWYR